VLELGLEQLPQVTQVRVSLIRGLDQRQLQNPDKTAVQSVVTPTFVVPTDCAAPPVGGAGGDSSTGAGGAGTLGGASTLGGAGGDLAQPAAGGAGGQDSTPLAGATGDGMAAAGIGGA
jgi:hypothetical protein